MKKGAKVKDKLQERLRGIAEKVRARFSEKEKLHADIQNLLDTISVSVTAIGIDVGTSCIKAAVLKGSGKTSKVLEVHTNDIPRRGPGRSSPEAVTQAIHELISSLGKLKDPLVVGTFSAQSAMIRNIDVPFKKESRISQVIKFETEPHIPVPIEDVVVNHWSLPIETEGGTSIMVATVRKSVLSSYIDIMKEAGMEPEVVELEAFSLFNGYLLTEESREAAPTLILDIGAGKSTALLAVGKYLYLVRSIGVGGDAFTLAIAGALGVAFPKAEGLKLAFSSGEGGDSDREKEILAAIQNPLSRLYREIDVTISSASLLLKGQSIERVILSGGGSKLPGVTQYISSRLGCSVDCIGEVSRVRSSSPADTVRCLAAIGAAAGQTMRLERRTNLRQEELAYSGKQARLKKQLTFTVALAASIVVAWVGLFFFNLHLKKKLHRDLRSELARSFRESFPGVRIESGDIVEQMENEYEKLQEQYQSFKALSEGSISSLEILREISSLLPASLDMQVTDINIEEDDVSIKGKTTEFATVDSIENALRTSKYFESVKNFPAEKDRDGNIKFRFELVRPQ